MLAWLSQMMLAMCSSYRLVQIQRLNLPAELSWPKFRTRCHQRALDLWPGCRWLTQSFVTSQAKANSKPRMDHVADDNFPHNGRLLKAWELSTQLALGHFLFSIKYKLKPRAKRRVRCGHVSYWLCTDRFFLHLFFVFLPLTESAISKLLETAIQGRRWCCLTTFLFVFMSEMCVHECVLKWESGKRPSNVWPYPVAFKCSICILTNEGFR